MSGTLIVYRWELRKLLSQKRTYLGLLFAAGMAIIFVTLVAARNRGPQEVPFGRYVLQSGLAVPLVLLTFGAYWLFPLITALVAGDIVASEDHNGTMKTILTRSLDRAPSAPFILYVSHLTARIAVSSSHPCGVSACSMPLSSWSSEP